MAHILPKALIHMTQTNLLLQYNEEYGMLIQIHTVGHVFPDMENLTVRK